MDPSLIAALVLGSVSLAALFGIFATVLCVERAVSGRTKSRASTAHASALIGMTSRVLAYAPRGLAWTPHARFSASYLSKSGR